MDIEEKNCMQAWKKALKYVMDNGTDFTDTDQRECREVLNLTVTITDPESDYDMPVEAMKNFDWIYPSPEELSAIMFGKEEEGIYEYSYGPRMFNFEGKKDQVTEYVIPLLKKDINTRRAVISLFNPVTDSDILNKNVPSLMFIHFKITDNRLRTTCFIRSNDIFIGWPGNIYQIYMLQKYIADKLGVGVGTLSTISCSAHIFTENIENIEKIL